MKFQWNFFWCRSGSVAIATAIGLPLLCVAAGGAIDYSRLIERQSNLQSRLDVAALSAAHIFIDNPSLSESKQKELIRQTVVASLAVSGSDLGGEVTIAIDMSDKLVNVSANLSVETTILKLANLDSFDRIVRAVAAAQIESQPVCILALDSSINSGIEFTGAGEMKAKDCVVWSNSAGSQSVSFNGNGKVTASRVCAHGRVGALSQFSVNPKPESDCAIVADPLSNWVAPDVGVCTFEYKGWISQTTAQLNPGTYCGGLRVDAKNILMSPGIYVIKDGPLVLRGSSKIKGKDVGIFLTGAGSKLDIDGKSQVELIAAETGTMSGITIAAARTASSENSSIAGRSDLKIGGVIYLPTHRLSYWGESDTLAASPVTTIISQTISIGGDSYLEVKNDKAKAKYAPVVSTGLGSVQLIR